MNKKNIDIVVSNQLCSGCGTCSVVCPEGCITMEKTNIGRLYAKIDTDQCTHCGLCYENCPSIDNKNILIKDQKDPFTGEIKNVYTAKSLNKDYFNNSQSGGLVTTLLDFLFETKQIDVAIVCINTFGKTTSEINYKIISKKEDLPASQKSCYTPIDMVSALKDTANFKAIAFVGLPCHIQGITELQNNFKKYQNIKYKFGLVCDRSLSEKISDVLIKGKNKNEDKKIIFRNKNLTHKNHYYNYKNAPVVVKYKNGDSDVIPNYYRFLLKDMFTSPRCKICFDKLNIHADIVFGDPWGMKNTDSEKGESLILTRTTIGDDLLKQCLGKGKITLTNRLLSEVIEGQQINKRKSQILTFIQVFKKHNWIIPEYLQLIGKSLANIKPSDETEANNLITNYLNLEKKDSKYIVKYGKSYLRKAVLKIKMDRLFKILHLTHNF